MIAITILGGIAALFGIIGGLVKFFRWLGDRRKEPDQPTADSTAPDPKTVELVEEAVLELGRLEDLLSQLLAMLRARPSSAFDTPRGKKLFEELEQQGNDWNVRANPLRWRIENTDAGAAFDEAMTGIIEFYNASSLIKLEGEDLPHRMEPARGEVEKTIRGLRDKCVDHYGAVQVSIERFRTEARTIAGFDGTSRRR